ncbi:MAG: DUF362 domain-containing protein [Chloroflexota bacterium]
MNTVPQQPYRVRAVHCDYRAGNEEVYQALKRATDPLACAWERLSRARRIAIKFNHDWQPNRLVTYQGQRQQLVSDTVARAVLRLLKERTPAEIFAVDVGVESLVLGPQREQGYMILPVLREFGVPYVDGVVDGVTWVDVPGGGQMFERYPIPQSVAQADEVVSVQKIKNHAFMGVTLCLKNLFGLLPLMPHGRPRHYYHHLGRMPYMLADLGRVFDPALNILDGLVCQAGQEWGLGEDVRVCNTLVAGDQVIATDAAATHLMGHDPYADWLAPPFHRDRNAILVAAQGGYGTVNLDEIDFRSEVPAPIGVFFAREWDSREMIVSWQRTTAEQGLFYREHRDEFVAQYAGKYILLQMGEVRWTSDDGQIRASRRLLSGENPEQAMWLKYVDPQENEGEHFEVYENLLRHSAFQSNDPHIEITPNPNTV